MVDAKLRRIEDCYTKLKDWNGRIDYPYHEFYKVMGAVCEDWGVPEIKIKINNRLRAYLGKFRREYGYGNNFCYQLSTEAKEDAVKWGAVWIEMAGFHVKRKRYSVMKTLIHELAHYIEWMLYGATHSKPHTPRFYETMRAIEATLEKLVKEGKLEGR